MFLLDAIQKQISELIKQSPDAAKNPMKYVREAIQGYSKEQLNKAISNCNVCNCKCKTRTLFTGAADADLMIIMDYPTFEQAEADKPIEVFDNNKKVKKFVLDCLKKHNVNIDRLAFINAVNCCLSRTVQAKNGTREEYRTPLIKERDECQDFVKYAVDIVHPPMMIIMGNVASNIYIPKTAISEIHGKWQSVYCIPTMVTYSPHEINDYHALSIEKAVQMLTQFKEDIDNAIKCYKRLWPNSKLFADNE